MHNKMMNVLHLTRQTSTNKFIRQTNRNTYAQPQSGILSANFSFNEKPNKIDLLAKVILDAFSVLFLHMIDNQI